MERLLLATRNDGKVREMRALLKGSGIRLETLASHPDVGEIEETGHTFDENARRKAATAARASGLWTLAEDSGLEVDALDGAPGVRSARYAGVHGDDAANNRKLLRELEGKPNRRARFVCVMALARSDGEIVATTRGICEGDITSKPRGENGFGYDPCFRPEGRRQTMAELDAEAKTALSHRGRAARTMLPLLHLHLGA